MFSVSSLCRQQVVYLAISYIKRTCICGKKARCSDSCPSGHFRQDCPRDRVAIDNKAILKPIQSSSLIDSFDIASPNPEEIHGKTSFRIEDTKSFGRLCLPPRDSTTFLASKLPIIIPIALAPICIRLFEFSSPRDDNSHLRQIIHKLRSCSVPTKRNARVCNMTVQHQHQYQQEDRLTADPHIMVMKLVSVRLENADLSCFLRCQSYVRVGVVDNSQH